MVIGPDARRVQVRTVADFAARRYYRSDGVTGFGAGGVAGAGWVIGAGMPGGSAAVAGAAVPS